VPFLVQHRDEYTETVGFKIIHSAGEGSKTAIFIPDIDTWLGFEDTILNMVKVEHLECWLEVPEKCGEC
jgi:pyrroloquinoline quinone biosynthesis protein B